VEKTTQNIRDVMADLRPQVLDDYGLAAALRWLCERFFQRWDIDVDLETDTVEEIRLPEMVETALFRITQEAFNNVIKHACATHVSAAVVKGADFIQLNIVDNGQGFDPRAVRSSEKSQSWGLVNMRERSEALGGQFQIESELKKGTRLRVEIPL
jgi:signal transduction histidine kinase